MTSKKYTLFENHLAVTITLCGEVVVRVELAHQTAPRESTVDTPEPLLRDLKAYLRGEKVDFTRYQADLSHLTPFQQQLLNHIRSIPQGETITYGMLARQLNTSPRAVGGALSKNPVPLVIPCHRVVGRKGIGGFSCGVEIKKRLLAIEGLTVA